MFQKLTALTSTIYSADLCVFSLNRDILDNFGDQSNLLNFHQELGLGFQKLNGSLSYYYSS